MPDNLSMFEAIVKTFGYYAGIFDLASEAHQQERFYSGWEKAKHDAINGQGSWTTLFHFNGLFIDRARRGEILGWTLPYDACFKAHTEVLPEEEDLFLTEDWTVSFLGPEAHDLVCRSGKIAIASFHKLGDHGLAATFEISPGVYRVGMKTNGDGVEFELDDDCVYPVDGEPDWYFRMKKVAEL
jgi:hypothetical protein